MGYREEAAKRVHQFITIAQADRPADILADVMHYCDIKKLGFEEELDHARRYLEEEQEVDTREALMTQRREHYRKVRRDLRLGSIWTDFDVENLNEDHAFQGNRKLVYDAPWGNPVTVDIQGDTWMNLWQAADQAIKQSNDNHHIYIKRFEQHPSKPRTLILITGS